MSSRPMPINGGEPKRINPDSDEAKRKAAAEKASRRSDALYVAGALLVAIGAGMIQVRYGLIAAGFFCLLLPLLELAGSFIRGLRPQTRGR